MLVFISERSQKSGAFPVTGTKRYRYVRIADVIYISDNNYLGHKEIVEYFELKEDDIHDAGFLGKMNEESAIVVSDESMTLNIGEPGSPNRKETVKLIAEVTGESVNEPPWVTT